MVLYNIFQLESVVFGVLIQIMKFGLEIMWVYLILKMDRQK